MAECAGHLVQTSFTPIGFTAQKALAQRFVSACADHGRLDTAAALGRRIAPLQFLPSCEWVFRLPQIAGYPHHFHRQGLHLFGCGAAGALA